MKIEDHSEEVGIELYGLDEYSLDTFVNNAINIQGVAWCNGIVMMISHVDGATFSETLIEKKKRVFASIEYALMPEYEPELSNRYNGKIAVTNYSESKVFSQLVDHIHEKRRNTWSAD